MTRSVDSKCGRDLMVRLSTKRREEMVPIVIVDMTYYVKAIRLGLGGQSDMVWMLFMIVDQGSTDMTY